MVDGSAPSSSIGTLVVVLTLLTGITDATAVLRIGGVFTSVMTGNIVFLGIDIGQWNWSASRRTLIAIAAYLVGVAVGSVVTQASRFGGRPWQHAVRAALGVEGVAFVLFAGLWWYSKGQPATWLTSCLLGVAAAGLGIQGAAILRIGIPGLSSTYLTGTLTTLTQQVIGSRSLLGSGRSATTLLALACGGALGAAACSGPRWMLYSIPVAQLALVGIALAATRVPRTGSNQSEHHRRRHRESDV